MEVQYRQAFLKDLKQLKSSTSYQTIIAQSGICCEGRSLSPFNSTYTIGQNTGKSQQL
ncbi:hypothetical protein [Microcoleus anatoxicus]|uniref:hypothetical protein n=1 Tax=Microcoleus anatoxicus TaxID=2705319 RepID=UPI0030C8ED4A